jgi:putative membrane protein
MNSNAVALLVAGLALAPAASTAQTAAPANALPPPTFSRTASPGDRDFVYAMIAAGRTQIALAQLAEERAQSDATRDLARNSETEWNAVTGRLSAIASAQGLPMPTEISADGQAEIDRLRTTADTAFDSTYTSATGRADQRALERMQDERRSGNPALIAAVNDYLHWFTVAVAVTSNRPSLMPPTLPAPSSDE